MKLCEKCLFLFMVMFSIASAAAAQLNIVALGASNTEGLGVGREAAYPSQLEQILRQRGIDAQVTNEGRSGETARSMLGRLGSAVPSGTSVVIFDPSRNGLLRLGGSEDNRSAIAGVVSQLRARGVSTIVIYPYREYANMMQSDGIHISQQAHLLLAKRLADQIAGSRWRRD